MVNIIKNLCNASTILMGIWRVGEKLDKSYDPWKSCPNSLVYAKEETREKAGNDALFDHPVKYSCLKQPYYTAHYETTCSFIPIIHAFQLLEPSSTTSQVISESVHSSDSKPFLQDSNNKSNATLHPKLPHHRSLQFFSKKTKKHKIQSSISSNNSNFGKSLPEKSPASSVHRIVYIGDSLITESYLAAKCLLEHYRMSPFMEVSYIGEVFLRDDIPCDPLCINNATMFLPYQGQIRNPCWACADGRLRTWKEFIKRPSSWVNRVPNDTIAVVIGGGTWYNGYKGLIDPSASYLDTLQKMIPILKQWISERKITVFWQGLIPTIKEHLVSLNLTELYGWAHFDGMDHLAKSLLEPIGVQFINVSALTRERKRLDINLTADPVHWCNPGLHSVPAFLNHVYFHLLASQRLVLSYS